MTHTGRMTFPIRPGTARRLGIRRPGKMEETWERSDRPGWGSTDCPAAWTETIGATWSATAGGRITSPAALDGPRDGRVITAEHVRQRQGRSR